MSSYEYSYDRCFRIVDTLNRISSDDIKQLHFSCLTKMHTEVSDKASEPMLWIGIYIAIASFFCILAMVADLFHGIRNKKFWFPCKYFSLNAASITVITVAMKLPVDLSSDMPSYMDQAAKLGSLGFMCTMMANFMPSLASMDNKTLLANVIGLCILVITMIVNICIQIYTRVINGKMDRSDFAYMDFPFVAFIYSVLIILLLIIIISASLTIPTSKEILESKYYAKKKISSTHQCLQHNQMSLVEKLRQHVRRYWVMAETGSPQFVMASNPLSATSGIICALSLLITINIVLFGLLEADWGWKEIRYYKSPYKWSTVAIFVTQSIGVVVGTIAPIFRCLSIFNFKLANILNTNNFMFFKVEKYWTQKLCEWKHSPIPFLSSSRRVKGLLLNSKVIVLSFCIGFQKVIVVSCKVIWLIATTVVVIITSCLYCWKSLKARWFTPSIASRTGDLDEELINCVLQIDNELELSGKTLNRIANSMSSFILKAANEEDNRLLELLEKSTGFEGVDIFDTDHVQPLLRVELANCWSLPIVTLTCITLALPNIRKEEVQSLLRSVGEGLSFTYLVEESLNTASEYVNTRKTTRILWHEAEHKCKWLDNPLAKNASKGITSKEIVKYFSDKAKEIVTKIKGSITDGELAYNPPHTLIAANSMYRITQTILLRYQNNIEQVTKKQLFAHLNGMIADIFSACFTNIPRVITMRCHESVIENREASVKVAAKLLGKAIKIIERLETLELPSMDDDKMAYIDEWRLYLKLSIS